MSILRGKSGSRYDFPDASAAVLHPVSNPRTALGIHHVFQT